MERTYNGYEMELTKKDIEEITNLLRLVVYEHRTATYSTAKKWWLNFGGMLITAHSDNNKILVKNER